MIVQKTKKRSLIDYFIVVILIIVITLMATGSRGQGRSVPPLQSRERMSLIANRMVGIVEATGHNDGVMVEFFLRTCGLPKGYPWCAAFIKTCFELDGLIFPNMNALAASTFNPKDVVYQNRKFYREPKSWDVFVMFTTSLHRIGHTLFYHKRINSSIFESIEGNTNNVGSREGDGVHRKKRSFHQMYKGSNWFKS